MRRTDGASQAEMESMFQTEEKPWEQQRSMSNCGVQRGQVIRYRWRGTLREQHGGEKTERAVKTSVNDKMYDKDGGKEPWKTLMARSSLCRARGKGAAWRREVGPPVRELPAVQT